MFSGLMGTLADRAMARTPQGSSPFTQGPQNQGIGAGGMSGMAEGMFGSKEQNKEDGSPWGSLVKKASFEFNEKGAEGPTDEAKAKPMTPPQAPEQPTIGAGFSGFKFPSWVPGSQPIQMPYGPIMGPPMAKMPGFGPDPQYRTQPEPIGQPIPDGAPIQGTLTGGGGLMEALLRNFPNARF